MEACEIFLQRLELLTEAESMFGDIAAFDDAYYASRKISLISELEESLFSHEKQDLTEQCFRSIYSEILSPKCASAKRKALLELLLDLYDRKPSEIIKSLEFFFEMLRKPKIDSNHGDALVDCVDYLSTILDSASYKDCQIILRNLFILVKTLKNVVNHSKSTRALMKILNKLLSRSEPLMPTYQIFGTIYASFDFVKADPSVTTVESKSVFYPVVSNYFSSFRLLSRMLSIFGRRYVYPIIQHNQCFNNPSSSFTPQHYKADFHTLVIKMSESTMCLDPDLREPMYDLIANCLLQPYCVHILERALLRPEKAAVGNQNATASGGAQTTLKADDKPANDQATNGLQKVLTNLFEQMIADDDIASRQWVNFVTNMQLLILKNQSIKVPIFINAALSALKQMKHKKLGENAKKLYFLLASVLTVMNINPSIKVTKQEYNCIIEIDEILAGTFPMNCVSLENSGILEMCRLVLWFNLRLRLQSLNHVEIELPKELQIAKSEVEQCYTNMSKETKLSQMIKLLNFEHNTSSPLHKKLVVDYFNNNNLPSVKLIGNIMACGQIRPLEYSTLSNLTMSARILLFQQISNHWRQILASLEKYGPTTNVLFPSPALIETYGRLYVDSFFETFYQANISIEIVITAAISTSCYRTFPIWAEILINLLPRANLTYLFMFCMHCISICNSKNRNKYLECSQFYSVLENACIQIMSWVGVKSFIALVEKFNTSNQLSNLISPDNEDYNKLFMLNVARCMHIAGVDCFDKSYKQFFDIIQGKTPHLLSHHMLHTMPAQLIALYQNQPFFQPEVNQKLKQEVENEYHNFLKLLSRQNSDVVNYVRQLKGHYFLCFFWKLLLSEEEPFKSSPPPLVCATILEQIGPKNLSKHIQTFCDFVNYEMLANMSKASKFIDAINRMIWEYDVMSIDRFVYVMILRPFGQKDDQVSLYFIHLLLQNNHQLKERIDFYCDLVSQSNLSDDSKPGGLFANWQQPYIQKYEERFHFEGLYRAHKMEPTNRFFFPTYFSNLCVRFLPIFDLVLCRFLEIPVLFKHLSTVLATYGKLLRLHKQPITFLYKTVAYYKKTVDTEGARMLVMAMHEAFRSVKPAEWLLSMEFLENAVTTASFHNWNPATSYLNTLIDKLTQAVFTPAKCEPFCRFNWEQEEFTSVASHVLYSICLEILCLPNITPSNVVNHLFELAFGIDSDLFNKYQRLNSVSLILNHLPPIYYSCIEDSILLVMKSEFLLKMKPEEVLKVCQSSDMKNEVTCSILKAQYLYYHANTSHLNLARQFLSGKLKPLVETEQQLILFCHLLSPFFLIYSDNKPISKTLYSEVIELLPVVMKSVAPSNKKLVTEDLLVDLLYFGKYTCVGDDLKPIVDSSVLHCGQSMVDKMKFY